MTKVRVDAWTKEQDNELAQTVLRHIREGSTQMNAFEEVGDEYNRTTAAVGFRWNKEIRHNYKNEIEDAKRYRKQYKKAVEQQTNKVKKETSVGKSVRVESYTMTKQTQSEPFDLESIDLNSYLEGVKVIVNKVSTLEMQLKTSNEKNQLLVNENELLHNQIEKMRQEYKEMEEDYQVLTQILNRARRMVLLEENEESVNTKHSFKMDKNGNLEKIAN